MFSVAFWQLVLAGGGGAVVVLLSLKFLGQRFIDASLAKGMENLRHRNIQEIEEKKFDFQRTFDRRTRVIQIELEVIPKIWALLLEATNRTKAAQARFRMTGDLESLSAAELAEWLAETEIPNTNKAYIVRAAAKDRNRLYSRADDLRLCFEARLASLEARNFLAVNAVLMPSALYEEFLAFSKMIDDATFDADLEAVHGHIPKEERRSDQFCKNSDETIAALGDKVRTLLTDG